LHSLRCFDSSRRRRKRLVHFGRRELWFVFFPPSLFHLTVFQADVLTPSSTYRSTLEPTCFANSLDLLIRLPGPIRTIPRSSFFEELAPSENAISLPREIWRLVDWLMNNAADQVSSTSLSPLLSFNATRRLELTHTLSLHLISGGHVPRERRSNNHRSYPRS